MKARVVAPAALLVASVLAYYRSRWPTVANLVQSIDHCRALFDDFRAFYYPMGRALLEAKRPILGYVYPAFFAVLLVPFGWLSAGPALWAWGVVQLGSLLAALVLPFRRLLVKPSPRIALLYIALTLTSLPVLNNLAWGQVSLLVLACVLWSLHAYMADRRILVGVMLAFAAAIKYYPALFLIPFIVKREKRVLVAFAAAAVCFYAALPAAVLGPGHWLGFERESRAALANAGWIAGDVNSQYIVHVGLRWLGSRPAAQAWGVALRAVGWIVALLNLLAISRLNRREVGRNADGNPLSFVALFLSLPFLLSTSWPHYFVYLPFCQVMLAGRVGWRRGDLGWPIAHIAIVLSAALSSVFAFRLCGHWSAYGAYGVLFVANGLLLIPLHAMAFGAPGAHGASEDDGPYL